MFPTNQMPICTKSRRSSFHGPYFICVCRVQDPGRVAAFMSLQATNTSCASGNGVYDELFNDSRVVGADEKCGQNGMLLG